MFRFSILNFPRIARILFKVFFLSHLHFQWNMLLVDHFLPRRRQKPREINANQCGFHEPLDSYLVAFETGVL